MQSGFFFRLYNFRSHCILALREFIGEMWSIKGNMVCIYWHENACAHVPRIMAHMCISFGIHFKPYNYRNELKLTKR